MAQCVDDYLSDKGRLEIGLSKSTRPALPDTLHIERCLYCFEQIEAIREENGLPPLEIRKKPRKKERTA
jgi:hypothetical protein